MQQDANASPPLRLTELAHGGGCGCKLAPAVLQQLLAARPAASFPQLLVGTDAPDDAAVWEQPDGTCLIATTDFFMPVVDDAADFGRIAAANAISDIYAMGGVPILALAILGIPLGKLPLATVRQILAGGAEICAEAGLPVAGGHSIDTPEPIYGLSVLGTARRETIRRKGGARPGDALILTKALGVGIYANALRKGALDMADYAEMLASTTLLNRIGAALGENAAVHAMTDVTGFGLLGHGLEMARASGVTLRISAPLVALFGRARALAEQGSVTGASNRNWDSYGADVRLPSDASLTLRHLLTDPQTSGGLLVSCAAESAHALLEQIRAAGYPAASIIGTVAAGPARIEVRAD